MSLLIPALLTILLVRLVGAIALYSQTINFIYHDQSYHLYYGLIFIMVAIVIKKTPFKIRHGLYAIGLGLVIDDIAVIKYLIVDKPLNPEFDYWSPLFIMPLLGGLSFMSLFENKLKKIIR